ncbi:MAG: ADP-ribosylglycohydrolase family protein [Eggerthellaceae bacterium]|nr:ADP-ribosylglycohydrolase family protein [Eggerthellaceae bacterium]
MIGPQPCVIAKETGERLFWDDELFGDFDYGELVAEGEIPAEWRPVLRGVRDAVYGAAVGDALGVPYEFMGRDSFECTGMASGGVHGKPAGTFSDDTSMMLALCDSIRECGRVDARDMRKRFNDWMRNGAYTADGDVFDVGNTVATALSEGEGCEGEWSNGNGSLMRIAPLAYTHADDDDVRAASAITHAHRISAESCVCLVMLIRNLVGGNPLDLALRYSIPEGSEFAFLANVASWPRDEVKSGGFVLDTLGAAIWCFANTASYAECVLAAVNLGGDSDTTACVAGALAGAYYGYESIPGEWIEALRGKDVIEKSMFWGEI